MLEIGRDHFGSPTIEQRELLAGRAIVPLNDRAVISLTGPDRLTWLDSVTSQQLIGLRPGDSAETLLLDPNGRIEHAMRVVEDGVSLWLLVDSEQAAPLEQWLGRMKFMAQVEIADRTAEFATVAAFADGLIEPAAPNDVPLVWNDPWREIVSGGWQYASAQEHPGLHWTYREVLVERDALSSIPAERLAGTLALEALRIAAWRPRLATEGDERSIPHELDWLRSAVHLAKGCYRGQETVAKVHNLGRPPRRLVLLHLDGSDSVLPVHGDEVELDDKVVGAVTSAAMHHELGPIALALVRRNVPTDAALAVRSEGIAVAAAQGVIVPPTAGATAGVPRLPRLGGVQR
ncbi:YgfZ/GcvT domain-containing protein [Ruicaihuangia caeni]|uniref:Glycine cleavage T C-terminal barrel domain-containing protein n=1 Tax=Ruicaihuangia caeni TaxID=3042517 RepID=A0AAW6T9J8_9MICO|nr:glycine cleavage T C-terminal barrel domain-containing protein [Klugiella sp. YN-L-19]MDI2098740.1 glycine cleavage T C-terminal barrel domain-containing protein [Klugiella sp. YN-L-19]